MKKILSLFAITILTALIVPKSEAQTFVRLVQGTAADTLKKSETHYTSTVNVGSANTQTVSVTVAIDSVSGTPKGTATLYQSVDGTHWNTTGSSATWKSTGTTWTAHDTCFILSLNPFLGSFARVGIVTTSTTQKSKYSVTLRSSNK